MRDKILNLLKEKGDLPPLPEVLFSLEMLVNDPDSDIESIAELVETEPVLSGKLVNLANSVFFAGGREKIKTVPSVVLRLGLKALLDLAYTLALPQMFEKIKGVDQIRFWKHSLAVALLARSLALHVGLKEEERDFYLGGLVHDLGTLVFFFLIPDEYKECSKGFQESDLPSEVLEMESLGITHSELGAEFLKQHWSVSQKILLATRTHHEQVVSDNSHDVVTLIVSAANTMVKNYGIDNEFTTLETLPSNNEFLGVFKLSAEELDSSLENIREAVDKAEKVLKG